MAVTSTASHTEPVFGLSPQEETTSSTSRLSIVTVQDRPSRWVTRSSSARSWPYSKRSPASTS